MTKRIVIIGGGAAGPKTASKLRREDPDVIIEMYTDEKNVSYSACGIPYFVEGIIKDVDELYVRSPKEFEHRGIHVFLEQKCIKICKEDKKVIIKDLNTNEERDVYYDVLVIATGASPYIPHIENINRFDNIYTLRKIEDGIALKDAMKSSKRATIIGFGYIGIEMLEAFVKNGLFVNIIDRNKYLMGNFDEDMSVKIQEHIVGKDGAKIRVYSLDEAVRFVGKNNRAEKVITKNGYEFETDFVLISAGIVPNSDIAVDAGLKTGVKKSIWVNSHMETSEQGIYAVGDCCEKKHIVTKRACWYPLGSTANREGRCAAINIASKNCDFEGVLGSAVSRYFDFTVAMAGLTEKQAKTLGYDTVSTIVTKNDRAGYMPEAATIALKLIADTNSHEIIGVQGVGTGDAEKRVATASIAIMEGVKVEDFMSIDLPYAPPYSTAIDPLLNAVQILMQKLNID